MRTIAGGLVAALVAVVLSVLGAPPAEATSCIGTPVWNYNYTTAFIPEDGGSGCDGATVQYHQGSVWSLRVPVGSTFTSLKGCGGFELYVFDSAGNQIGATGWIWQPPCETDNDGGTTDDTIIPDLVNASTAHREAVRRFSDYGFGLPGSWIDADAETNGYPVPLPPDGSVLPDEEILELAIAWLVEDGGEPIRYIEPGIAISKNGHRQVRLTPRDIDPENEYVRRNPRGPHLNFEERQPGGTGSRWTVPNRGGIHYYLSGRNYPM